MTKEEFRVVMSDYTQCGYTPDYCNMLHDYCIANHWGEIALMEANQSFFEYLKKIERGSGFGDDFCWIDHGIGEDEWD